MTEKKSQITQNKTEKVGNNLVGFSFFGKYDLSKNNLFKLSIFSGIVDSLNFYLFIFSLFFTSIFLIINNETKNRFILKSLLFSYFLSYFLYTISFLNVFIYSKYLNNINLIFGYFTFLFSLNNFYCLKNKKENILNKFFETKNTENVKIDISLYLLFFIVFAILDLNSLLFSLNSNTSYKITNFIISEKISLINYYFNSFIMTLISSLIFSLLLILFYFIYKKILKDKYKNEIVEIGYLLLMITSFLIIFI